LGKWKVVVLLATVVVLGLLLLQRCLNYTIATTYQKTTRPFESASRAWREAAGVAKNILKHPGNEWTQEDIDAWQQIFLACNDLAQEAVATMIPNPAAPATGPDAPDFGSLRPRVERIRETLAELEKKEYQEENVARFLPAFNTAVGDAGL
jgi:hypothetical protein